MHEDARIRERASHPRHLFDGHAFLHQLQQPVRTPLPARPSRRCSRYPRAAGIAPDRKTSRTGCSPTRKYPASAGSAAFASDRRERLGRRSFVDPEMKAGSNAWPVSSMSSRCDRPAHRSSRGRSARCSRGSHRRAALLPIAAVRDSRRYISRYDLATTDVLVDRIENSSRRRRPDRLSFRRQAAPLGAPVGC